MVYRFAECELDEHLYQLRRNGASVAVEPKVFGVLAYLVHNHDRVISKDELLEKLWLGQVVGEAALSRCIGAARKAVGDDGDRQAIIETQHGRGYRFIAPLTTAQPVVSSQEEEESQKAKVKNQKAKVEETEQERMTEHPQPADARLASQSSVLSTQSLSAPTPVRARSSRALLLMGLLLLVGTIVAVQYLSQPSSNTQPLTPNPQPLSLPDKPSIIVLPFTNLSGDPGQEYFSDGMTEEITGSLSRLASLFVIARTSAFTYKGKAAKAQDISREMGVRYILEGSVLKADGQVRITAQLIDATTGYHLWSERYDRPLADIFAVQDEIARKIVTTLKLQLTLREQGSIVRKTTDNLEAYDTFLRGLEYYWHQTKEATAQAKQMWEKAIGLDPRYAEAYAWLGAAYWKEWAWHWNTDPQTLERALALVQQALVLDDSLSIAHSRLGQIYASKRQFDQALAESERATALNPNNADSYAFQAEVLNPAGRPEEARRMVLQAMRLNPHYLPFYSFNLGWACRMTGRYAEAITALKDTINRSPNMVSAYWQLTGVYVQQWAFQQSPDVEALALALAAARRALVLNNVSPHGHVFLGIVYLWQKQYDPALAEMEQAVTLDSNEALSYASLAETLSRMGRSAEALQMVEQALQRKSGIVDFHLLLVGSAYYLAGKPAEAIAPLKQFLARYPHILGAHLNLAAAYSELGQEAEARAEAAEVLRLSPQFSLAVHKERVPIKDPALLERHLAALRQAGLK